MEPGELRLNWLPLLCQGSQNNKTWSGGWGGCGWGWRRGACSQTSRSLLRSDLIASGCLCSRRTEAKPSPSGCGGGGLHARLRGHNCSVSSCYFTPRERRQLHLFVFVKKHLRQRCLFMRHVRQARPHENTTLKTRGRTETDTQTARLNSVSVFSAFNHVPPAVYHNPLSLFPVCHRRRSSARHLHRRTCDRVQVLTDSFKSFLTPVADEASEQPAECGLVRCSSLTGLLCSAWGSCGRWMSAGVEAGAARRRSSTHANRHVCF